MRSWGFVAGLTVLLIGAAGCGDPQREGSPPSNASPLPTASPAASTTSAAQKVTTVPPPEDLSLAVARVPGHPACGLYSIGGEFLDVPVRFGVAVQPVSPRAVGTPDVTVKFETDLGDKDSVSFLDGSAQDVAVTTLPGSEIGYIEVDLASQFWEKYRSRTTLITVTVDPKNQVRESNENNNVVKLRVQPKGKPGVLKLGIAENTCSVLA